MTPNNRTLPALDFNPHLRDDSATTTHDLLEMLSMLSPHTLLAMTTDIGRAREQAATDFVNAPPTDQSIDIYSRHVLIAQRTLELIELARREASQLTEKV